MTILRLMIAAAIFLIAVTLSLNAQAPTWETTQDRFGFTVHTIKLPDVEAVVRNNTNSATLLIRKESEEGTLEEKLATIILGQSHSAAPPFWTWTPKTPLNFGNNLTPTGLGGKILVQYTDGPDLLAKVVLHLLQLPDTPRALLIPYFGWEVNTIGVGPGSGTMFTHKIRVSQACRVAFYPERADIIGQLQDQQSSEWIAEKITARTSLSKDGKAKAGTPSWSYVSANQNINSNEWGSDTAKVKYQDFGPDLITSCIPYYDTLIPEARRLVLTVLKNR